MSQRQSASLNYWSLYYYVSFKFFSGTKFKLVGFLYYLNEKSFTLNDIANV